MADKGTKKAAHQWVELTYDLIDSPAWGRLPARAKEAYVYLLRSRYRRISQGRLRNTDNGYLRFGPGDAPGMNKSTFKRAMNDLRIHGFVDIIEESGWPNRKGVYALVDLWEVKSGAEYFE